MTTEEYSAITLVVTALMLAEQIKPKVFCVWNTEV